MGSMMLRQTKNMFAVFAALVVFLLYAAPAEASFSAAYCSSQNTASDSAPYWHQYQSNGWCTDTCNQQGKYAFAVVLDQNCWCSNYIPADQQDTSDCNENCPGFPDEKCGNKDKVLYIYIKLPNAPSGTKGSSEPTSAHPSSAPPRTTIVEVTPDPETVLKTVTAPGETVTQTLTPSQPSSSQAPTYTLTRSTLQTTTVPSTLTDLTSVAPAPQTSIRIITESGVVVTQTVISTPTSEPVLAGSQKSGSNTGAIVGGVIGGLAVLGASIGGIFFFLWRRRQQQQQQQQEDDFQSGVQRNTSTMSKAGLLRSEKDPRYPPPIKTSFTRRSSRMLDNDSISPVSGSDRRNSRHLVDQRLNPSAVLVYQDNSSRGSVASLDDSRDYHRPLNVRNPDPDPQ